MAGGAPASAAGAGCSAGVAGVASADGAGTWAATSPLLLGSVSVAGGAPAVAGWPPFPETSTGAAASGSAVAGSASAAARPRRRVRRSGSGPSAEASVPVAPGSSGWSGAAAPDSSWATGASVVVPPRRPRAGADEGSNSTPWALAMIAPIRSALRSRW